MKMRAWAAGTAIAVATTLGGGVGLAVAEAPSAAAARPATSLSGTSPCNITVPGTTTAVPSTCTVTVTSVQVVNGALQVAGRLTSSALPTNIGLPTTSSGAPYVPVTQAPLDPASCPVLALTLGPLHLNLLGLVVDLNQVNLNITAVPGPGNLLGNLLCSVANLLNGNGVSPALTNLLNHINAILAGL